MLILIGCVLSFTIGAACVVLCARLFGRDQYDALRGQWEDFLNYTGDE